MFDKVDVPEDLTSYTEAELALTIDRLFWSLAGREDWAPILDDMDRVRAKLSHRTNR